MGFNLSDIRTTLEKAKQVAQTPVGTLVPAIITTAKSTTEKYAPSPLECVLERAVSGDIPVTAAAGTTDALTAGHTWKYPPGHLNELRITAFLRKEGARDLATGKLIAQEAVKAGSTHIQIAGESVVLVKTGA